MDGFYPFLTMSTKYIFVPKPTDCDLPEEPVVGVDDSLPGDGVRINVKQREFPFLLLSQTVRVS